MKLKHGSNLKLFQMDLNKVQENAVKNVNNDILFR